MCHDLYTKGCWKFVIVCFHWKKKQVGFFVIFTIWVELNQKYLISRKTFRIFGTFFYYKCLFMCLNKGKNMIFVTLLLLSNIQDQKSSKHFAQLSSFIEFIHVLFSLFLFSIEVLSIWHLHIFIMWWLHRRAASRFKDIWRADRSRLNHCCSSRIGPCSIKHNSIFRSTGNL